jgi:hypothetical protein
MVLSPFWEAVSCAAAQEIPNILCEPEGSLPCSQEPSPGPYPEPDECSPYHAILSNIHFNIIHPRLGRITHNIYNKWRTYDVGIAFEKCKK